MSEKFDEKQELRKAQYLARFLSWQMGRKVARPRGNDDGCGTHWIHQPLCWADTGEPITTKTQA